MDGAEQVQTHLKAKDGSHTMKGEQLEEQQEYRLTQLIPNLGVCFCFVGFFFHPAAKMLNIDTLDTLLNSRNYLCS